MTGYQRSTNLELAADVVAVLMHDGMIARSDLMIARIRDVVGVNRVELRRAASRQSLRGWQPLRFSLSAPEDNGGQRYDHPGRATHRHSNGSIELRCTGGVHDPAHWATEHEFDLRSDGTPGRRKSKCRTHWLETQRARRITRDAAAAFDEADIDILYDDNGRPVGIECTRCGSKIGCDCATG